MAIVRWRPGWSPTGRGGRSHFDDFDGFRKQMMNIFDNLSNASSQIDQSRVGVFPPLNIREDEDNLYVTAELPGVPTGELDIILENDNLILRGERKIPETEREANFHLREREAGAFRRAIHLPAKIDSNKVTAMNRNGVLDIILPKAEQAKPRQIEVKVE